MVFNLIAKKRVILTIFLFLALLFAISINAQSQEILTYTNSTFQQSCPCQPVIYYFYLKNPTALPEVYSLKVDSELAKYAKSTVPSKFTLQPSQEINFKLVIQAPCELYGTKNFNLVINSGKGQVTYPLTYDILPCYSYEIETGELANNLESLSFIKHELSYDICENESKILPVKITNNAEFSNKYSVKLQGRNALLKVNSFSLDSSKSAILPIRISMPKYDKNTSILTLTLKSEKGELEKSANIQLNSIFCITPEIKTDFTQFAINYTKQEQIFTITNLGNKKETYEINFIAPDWVKFQKTQITLVPQQSKDFTILFEPTETLKRANYNAIINVKALSTGNIYSKEFTVKLTGKSFKDKLILYSSKFYSSIKTPLSFIIRYIWFIVLGLLILFIIFFLIKQYSEFRKLEKEKIVKQTVKVKQLARKEVRKGKRYKLSLPLISPYLIFLGLIILILIFAYYNLKPAYQKPELELAQPYIKPFNISEINISLIQPNISALETIAEIKEKSADYIYIISFILLILFSSLIIYFVKRKRDKEFEKEFEQEIKEEIKELGPIEEKIREEKPEEEKPKKEKKEITPSLVFIVSIIGIIILLALALFFFKFPYSITTFIPNQSIKETKIAEYQEPVIINNTKIPALILEQSKQHIVNLTEYFYDPDNDELYFTALTGENMLAEINEQGIAVLKPKKGFYGTSSIVFIADDRKGGIAQTNNITLVVRKKK